MYYFYVFQILAALYLIMMIACYVVLNWLFEQPGFQYSIKTLRIDTTDKKPHIVMSIYWPAYIHIILYSTALELSRFYHKALMRRAAWALKDQPEFDQYVANSSHFGRKILCLRMLLVSMEFRLFNALVKHFTKEC